jgi:hypothetical protein
MPVTGIKPVGVALGRVLVGDIDIAGACPVGRIVPTGVDVGAGRLQAEVHKMISTPMMSPREKTFRTVLSPFLILAFF